MVDEHLQENGFEKKKFFSNGLIADGLEDALVPEEKSLNELIFYPIWFGNKPLTLLILLFVLFLSQNYFGMCISVFILIIYSVYLIRKNLCVKETWRSDSFFLMFIAYALITNFTGTFILAVFVYVIFESLDSFIFTFSLPIIAFINIVFTSGIIITFALAENRIIWTYHRYFKQLFLHNIFCFALLTASLFVFYVIFSIIECIHLPFCFMAFFACLFCLFGSYILIATVVSWTKFLYKDLYPEIPPEIETEVAYTSF